ncbi:MAG: tRNA 4-thiouridine(8) synthase ThiI [Oscillospiraceae bacterium]|nr:tRNA 4-thiouridine(8) synthase ThiI [Oscillospiraceae bacterium]
MKQIIMCYLGEMALKGLNKSTFEAQLMKTIRNRLKNLGQFKIYKAQSTFYIEAEDEYSDIDAAFEKVKKVFGIAAVSKAVVTEKNFDKIAEMAPIYLEDALKNARTFKVTAKRSDKSFPMGSLEISREVGAAILRKFHHLKVDVHNPQVTVMVEIRDFGAYIHEAKQPGAGGMPVSTSGKGALMLSGGIDSPVAAYMMAKRGMSIMSVHFASPPYTSDRARYKVITLAEKLTDYTGDMNLFIVPFTTVQEYIRDNGVAELFTILMRRSMMRITEKLSRKFGASAIITGESLGQVASQTMAAITATNASVDMPIFRPVIGMDKTEITEIARKIDTFETSILPYEDCCTIFTPPHPKTKPSLEEVINAETAMGLEKLFELEQQAADEAEKLRINVQ